MVATNEPVESADAAVGKLAALEDGAWAIAAFVHLMRTGALTNAGLSLSSPEDSAAARTLEAVGLVVEGEGGFRLAPGFSDLCSDERLEIARQATTSSLRQLATVVGILPAEDSDGWAVVDDATLLAQGKSSALGGRMLATFAVQGLDGLGARFSEGGDFLDVGVGVGELAAAFCETLPSSHVVGIDVLPRALDLAQRTIEERGLHGRLELRNQAVQELDDTERFDLAFMPAPFIPEPSFGTGVKRVWGALRRGGWLVVAAGRFDGDPLAVAVTRWKTLRAGGTALAADDARAVLEAAGFVEFHALPVPPGSPSLYAARRLQTSSAT